MKKTFALVLAVLLVFSLMACAGGNVSTSSSPSTSAASSPSAAPSPSASAAASPSESASAKPSAASPSASKPQLGFYDASYDYSKNPKYKVGFMCITTNSMIQPYSDCFQAWAKKANCEYSYFSANGDNDNYITTLQTYAQQGFKGFILDADPTVADRVVEVCKEIKVSWLPIMSPLRDTQKKLVAPMVGFDDYTFGVQVGTWLCDYAKNTWKLTDTSKLGMIAIDFSVSPELHARATGPVDVFKKNYPAQAANAFLADCIVTGKFDSQTSYDLVAAIMSKNTQIENWLISGSLDDWSLGCARAAEAAGKQDKTCIANVGGLSLFASWDKGENPCWKASIFAAPGLFTNPIFFGVYAMMNGQATVDQLWPEWVDHSKGEKYPQVLMKCYTLTKDNYKDYLGWVESVTGLGQYTDYSKDYKGTKYDIIDTVPASYAAK